MARLPFALALLATVAGFGPVCAQEAQPKDTPTKDTPTREAPPKPVSAPSVATTPVTPAKVARQPYLSDAVAPDTVAILPPPPRGHSVAENADKAAFTATRSLKGSPRWDLATTDVADGASAILDDFACVIGQRIDQTRAPALMTLLERSRLDIARATRGPKEHYRRIRPFVGNDAEICVVRSAEIANAFSFPSSHATQAWTYASIMAALMPEKATEFFLRARSYGESRVVCGLHWMSDIQAGRTTGSVVFASLQGDAGFRTDLERARTEVLKLVAGGGAAPDQAICAREAVGRTPIL